MITRPYFILQMDVDGEWKGIQSFTDGVRAEAALADQAAGDPWGEYRVVDRTYEIPEPVQV